LLSQTAYTQEAPTCPGASADILWYTYTGQQHIQSCVTQYAYVSGVMYIDLQNTEEDGIFKNGFD